MADHDAVLAGVHRSLRPGGRFVAECGGEGNVDTIRRTLHACLAERGVDPRTVDPWYFPSAAAYRVRLESAGFVVTHAELIPRPTPLPTAISGWLATFAHSFTQALPAAARPALLREVEDRLRPLLYDRSEQHRRVGGKLGEDPGEDGDGKSQGSSAPIAADGWVADYVRLRFRAVRPLVAQ